MSLEERVRAELLAVRKAADGLCLATMATSPVICSLLGDGDPAVALSTFKLRALDMQATTGLKAALSSLGLTSTGRTHLARLEDFGSAHTYDQRQVRRYSDTGIRQLATTIATNWATISVPTLDVTVATASDNAVQVFVVSSRHEFIDMRPLRVTLRQAEEDTELSLQLAEAAQGSRLEQRTTKPIEISIQTETSLTFVWRGELWPKFALRLTGDHSQRMVSSESLGNKLMVRFIPLRTS